MLNYLNYWYWKQRRTEEVDFMWSDSTAKSSSKPKHLVTWKHDERSHVSEKPPLKPSTCVDTLPWKDKKKIDPQCSVDANYPNSTLTFIAVFRLLYHREKCSYWFQTSQRAVSEFLWMDVIVQSNHNRSHRNHQSHQSINQPIIQSINQSINNFYSRQKVFFKIAKLLLVKAY